MEYDEDGSLAMARALAAIATDTAPLDVAKKPCPVGTLNGSWYLQLTPTGPHTLMEIRGPMRIEVASPKLRISGDIYVRKPTSVTGTIEIGKPITDHPFLFGKNWYPQFPIDQYAWYFRSLGVTYKMANWYSNSNATCGTKQLKISLVRRTTVRTMVSWNWNAWSPMS